MVKFTDIPVEVLHKSFFPKLDYASRTALNECLPPHLRYVRRFSKNECEAHALSVIHHWWYKRCMDLQWLRLSQNDFICNNYAAMFKWVLMPNNITQFLKCTKLRASLEFRVDQSVRRYPYINDRDILLRIQTAVSAARVMLERFPAHHESKCPLHAENMWICVMFQDSSNFGHL